ncbi:MAG: hypothetical protein D6820_13145, partial [Lentisphaerae bacterium]
MQDQTKNGNPVLLETGRQPHTSKGYTGSLAEIALCCRYRHVAVLALIACDLFSISSTFAIVVILRKVLGGVYPYSIYLNLWPVLFLFILNYEISGLYHGSLLYPGIAYGPVEELRRQTYATTIVFGIIIMSLFLFKIAESYSRLIFLGSWFCSLFTIPVSRSILRSMLAHKKIWGTPTVIIGEGRAGRVVSETIARHPEFGLRPAVI